MSLPEVDDDYEYDDSGAAGSGPDLLMRDASAPPDATAGGSAVGASAGASSASSSIGGSGGGGGGGGQRRSLGGGGGGGGSSSSSAGGAPALAQRVASAALDVGALSAQAGARARALASLFGLEADVEAVLTMLAHARWDDEALVDRWSDAGEAAVRAALGVSAGVPGPPPDAGAGAGAGAGGALAFCPVLLEDFPVAAMYALPCGHAASAPAWRGYLLALLQEPATGVLGRCLSTGCREALRPSTWERFLATPADMRALTRFREFFMRSFVAGCRTIASCPAPVMELGSAAAASSSARSGGDDGGGAAAAAAAPPAAGGASTRHAEKAASTRSSQLPGLSVDICWGTGRGGGGAAPRQRA